MPKPFVLVQVEDYSVSETNIVGVVDMVSIIVDWDEIGGDDEQAQDLINEIVARYGIGEGIGGDGSEVSNVIDRLEAIVQAVRDEEEEFEDECEEEEEEDGPDFDDTGDFVVIDEEAD